MDAADARRAGRKGSESSGFGNGSRKADALVIATGKTTEDLRYMKSIALELWLFAYELPETVIVLLRDGQAHVVTGKTKAALISQCKDECVAKSKGKVSGLHIHIRPKGTTGEDQFKQVLEEAKKAKQEEVSRPREHFVGWTRTHISLTFFFVSFRFVSG